MTERLEIEELDKWANKSPKKLTDTDKHIESKTKRPNKLKKKCQKALQIAEAEKWNACKIVDRCYSFTQQLCLLLCQVVNLCIQSALFNINKLPSQVHDTTQEFTQKHRRVNNDNKGTVNRATAAYPQQQQ